MSAIVPFHVPAVTSVSERAAARVERALAFVSGRAPRFAAAQLAEVEDRYAALLAAEVTPAEGCALSEAATVTIGTRNCDAVNIEAALAMWVEPAAPRTFIARLTVDDFPVELDSAKARDAAEKLRAVAGALDALAADAEALTAIESGR